MKFLHTMGAIGSIGSMASLLVLSSFLPAPTALAEYAQMRASMVGIAAWIFLPSVAVTLIAGLLAIAANTAYHNAGWAWAKAATGVLVFEWGFVAIQGPMQQQADLSARALAGGIDAVALTKSLGNERGSIWVLLVAAIANVALGVWRPRLIKPHN
jgi:hypothetical protein